MRHVAIFMGMIGGDLRHHAVRSNNLKHVQTFHDRGSKSDPSLILHASRILQAWRARYPSFSLGEGNQSLNTDVLNVTDEVAASSVVQGDRRLAFDYLIDRTLQAPAKYVSFGVVVVIRRDSGDCVWWLGHSGHSVPPLLYRSFLNL